MLFYPITFSGESDYYQMLVMLPTL